MGIRSYLSTILDGMAKGLFASLIIGVIIKQIGVYTGFKIIENFGQMAQYFMGPCIGIGVAFSRGSKQYTLLSAAIAGAIGAGTIKFLPDTAGYAIVVGEPMGALISAIIAIEVGNLIEGKTKFDLLIVPAIVILIGGTIGIFVSPVISELMTKIGIIINELTTLKPLPMGLLLGTVVGMLLTLPISSAALCISIGIDGLAAGAALAGCCAQMVGFAIISFRENRFSGLISQGIGTSMIQVPNIIRKPRIWIPTIISSGICGVLSTMVFHMETDKVGAGMGTSGLVGQFTTVSYMGTSFKVFISILLLHFIIPAVISLIISEFMRKRDLIVYGDLKI